MMHDPPYSPLFSPSPMQQVRNRATESHAPARRDTARKSETKTAEDPNATARIGEIRSGRRSRPGVLEDVRSGTCWARGGDIVLSTRFPPEPAP
jgi:hypothetical protein